MVLAYDRNPSDPTALPIDRCLIELMNADARSLLRHRDPKKNKEEDRIWQNVTPTKHTIPATVTAKEIEPNIEEFVDAESRNPVSPESSGLQTSLADIVVALKRSDTEESEWAFGKELSVRLMMNLDACHATAHRGRYDPSYK